MACPPHSYNLTTANIIFNGSLDGILISLSAPDPCTFGLDSVPNIFAGLPTSFSLAGTVQVDQFEDFKPTWLILLINRIREGTWKILVSHDFRLQLSYDAAMMCLCPAAVGYQY